MLDIDELIRKLNIPFETFDKIIERSVYNDMLSDFYKQYAEESGEPKYLNIAENVKHCYSNIIADRYKKRKVYDIKFVNFCHNRFCANCQKLIQATRLTKIAPVLSATMGEYDLCHIVFTVPNVPGTELSETVDVLFEAFANFIGYMKGKSKITGMDFSYLGYFAALRSLEITYNEGKGDYHPHLHSIFAFKKDLIFNKDKKNVFSYDVRDGKYEFKRYFCDLEILFQKLWRQIYDGLVERNKLRREAERKKTDILAKLKNSKVTPEELNRGYAAFGDIADIFKKAPKINAKRITKRKIEVMGNNDGYSVIMDPVADGNYYEVFKYAFKLFDEDERILGYDQFKTLLNAMEGRKQIQCYGAWYGIKLNDDIDECTKDELSALLIKLLQEEETAVKVGYLTVQELREQKKYGYAVITASKIMNLLRDYTPEELDTFLMDSRPLLEQVIQDLRYDKIGRKTWKEYGVANLNLNAPGSDEISRFKRKKQYSDIITELCKLFDVSYKQLSYDRQLHRDFVNGKVSEAELRRKLFERVGVLQEPIFQDAAEHNCIVDKQLRESVDIEKVQAEAMELAKEYSKMAKNVPCRVKKGV